MHSLDSSDGLRDVHQQLDDMLQEKKEESYELMSEGSGGGHDGPGDAESVGVEMPAFSDSGDGPGDVPVLDILAQAMGDPYDTSQNVVQPFTKGSHERRVKLDTVPHLNLEFLDGTPDAAFENGFLLTAQVLGNEPIRGKKPLNMSSLQDERREELKRRRQEAREKSDRNREEAQRLQSLIPADVDPTMGAARLDFDDDFDVDDNNAFDDFAEPAIAESSIVGLYTPSQADKWVQEAVQQMSQYQHLSEAEAAVHERVSNWTKRIEPILNMQEQEEHEKPFKLYHYANAIMEKFRGKKVLNFAEVVVADRFTDEENIHVARTFLASLQLANNGNVDLQHKVGLVSTTAPLFIKFVKEQQPTAFDDSGVPIIEDGPDQGGGSPPLPRPERPAKRKKVAA